MPEQPNPAQSGNSAYTPPTLGAVQHCSATQFSDRNHTHWWRDVWAGSGSPSLLDGARFLVASDAYFGLAHRMRSSSADAVTLVPRFAVEKYRNPSGPTATSRMRPN